MSSKGRILSIGQGRRMVPDLIAELRRHNVGFLVDVRSIPTSRYRPEFSRAELEGVLREHAIKYVFMGDLLGGRPDDPTCYDEDGHVDYARLRQALFFKKGIERLKHAYEQGLTVALMCSEADPGRCHRSKAIGQALAEIGISVEHIDAAGVIQSQEAVMLQMSESEASRSRKAHR